MKNEEQFHFSVDFYYDSRNYGSSALCMATIKLVCPDELALRAVVTSFEQQEIYLEKYTLNTYPDDNVLLITLQSAKWQGVLEQVDQLREALKKAINFYRVKGLEAPPNSYRITGFGDF